MARTYAQFAAVLFVVVGVAGLFTGDAGHVSNGQAGGNFDGASLHLTYGRDVIDLALAAVFAYAGFLAKEEDAWIPVLSAGGFLLLLAVIGFIDGDDASGTRSVATLHFPLAINIFDLITGVVSILCGLGSIDEEPQPARST